MDKKRFWDRASKPPADALKEIRGGRLAGKTDVNPQWRMEAMTDIFGPVGIGWRYEIIDLWTVPTPDGEVVAFSRVSVWYKDGDSWSEAVPGIGGSMLIAKEKSGLYVSDEAYKMATTDALSVAFKALGIASEIYRGHFDGSKYTTPPTPSSAPAAAPIPESVKERYRDVLSIVDKSVSSRAMTKASGKDWQKQMNAAVLLPEAAALQRLSVIEESISKEEILF